MKRICVFCGSARGSRPAYAEAARDLARVLAKRRIGLVYGGGSVGTMGVLADTALAEGTEVIGVIPRGLASRELVHTSVRDMRIVESMHDRKALMASLADGFVALPGGLGTLEETLEILTWAQLGIHPKPVGLLNVAGYWDRLLEMLAHAEREGFLTSGHTALLLAGRTAEGLLDQLTTWQPPAFAHVWLDPSQT